LEYALLKENSGRENKISLPLFYIVR